MSRRRSRLLERGALHADQVVSARLALEDTVAVGFEAVGRSDLPGVKVLVGPLLGGHRPASSA